MDEIDNSRSLIPGPDVSLASARPRPGRIMSGIVTDTLALARRELDASSTRLAPAVTASEDAVFLFQHGLRCQEEGGSIQAFKYFNLAAEQGDAEAQYQLGKCYDYGRGVAQKFTEAMKWFRKAAEQGHSKAQRTFATLLYTGRHSDLEVLKSDYVEAVKWLRRTVETANDLSLLWLAECYAEGKGISLDYCEAFKFYKLVSQEQWFLENPETGVQQRLDSIVRRMTTAEIAEGERRYHEFKGNRGN